MEVTMDAINLNTTAGRAINASIARSIAIAVIFATLGLTVWYGSTLYDNPVDFLFALGQFLCVIGLLYGLVLSIVHGKYAT
jgi:hypothetical protein